MIPQHIIAALLALAVVVGSARLLLRIHRGGAAARPRAWRVVALLALQVASACLFYFVLVPPSRPVDAGTMVVLTAHADRVDDADARAGEFVVALPEALSPGPPSGATSRAQGTNRDASANRVSARADRNATRDRSGAEPGVRDDEATESRTDTGIERVPDLATALRRHPGTTRLRVVGAGLTARDREAVAGRALSFVAMPLPRGIVELWSPQRVQAGDDVPVRGRVEGVAKGTAEVLDPGGRSVGRVALDDDGRFALAAQARSAGSFALRLRVRDAAGALVEQADVPLYAAAPAPRRVLLLAGAPSPELKYLRRWATDAGLSPHAQIALGGGLRSGDPAIAFDAATLGRFDLAIVDERAWQSLGAAQYEALRTAVRDGLGLLLRVSGPLSPQGRSRLRALGLTVVPARVAETVRLPLRQPGISATASDDGDDGSTDTRSEVPALSRRALRVDAIDGSPLLRDAGGTAIATWRAEGRGRIAVWLLADSFRLALAGHGEQHARLWSDAAGVLMRARGEREPELQGEARQGERVVLCGVAAGDVVGAPDGSRTPLLADRQDGAAPSNRTPGASCVGFWPTSVGWHGIRSGEDAWPFHVSARAALPGVRALALREATTGLVRTSGAPPLPAAGTPGSRSPWFLAWLAVAVLLWWLERTRHGLS